jgi:hypothetical protein
MKSAPAAIISGETSISSISGVRLNGLGTARREPECEDYQTMTERNGEWCYGLERMVGLVRS